MVSSGRSSSKILPAFGCINGLMPLASVSIEQGTFETGEQLVRATYVLET